MERTARSLTVAEQTVVEVAREVRRGRRDPDPRRADRLPERRGGAPFHPGERGAAVRVRRAEKGVPVAAKVWRERTESADKLGITPPEARSQG
ncbi:hypothetical protein [Streptomyces sp. AK02-04a]|uniref:hypothetical protein n=1 Tax=Streptomyces sp. AK02-04a TaxID=3028649 RepID=UPI0029A15B3B|nr:hypothetical protein [Streptomyces sp. AK02-04a]MDX3760496.1 hypothetical protein [Streptomyces sp. AK02-04a]